MRERLARGDDGVSRLGQELLAMMSEPQRYDHDVVHGPVLQGYVRLMSDHEGPRAAPTQDEIDALFAAAKARPKGSLIRDMANRSQWKDSAPSARVARAMSEDMAEVQEVDVGKRTVPSREIEAVDRAGEDAALTDRVAANVAAQDAPDGLKDVLIDELMAKSKAKRDRLTDAMEGLDDLLDD
jgi:hypothetical protein